MDHDEWLTRGTVWIAISLYVASEAAGRRWLNRLGCIAFLAHVACAFHFYHSWSHAAAHADTVRQTAEAVGWNSGVGLYINYLFAVVWIAIAFGSWKSPALLWAVRGFFWFMIFNGAVVFAQGPMRAFGLLLCLVLIAAWWPKRGAKEAAT